jgi:ADP-heptose:LPS heptosyltransferase
VTDTTGAFSVQELMAVIEGASIVITTDSGPFHMAGALGRPTLGLFRASRPEHAELYSTARVVMESHPDCADCRWNSCQASPCRQMAAVTSSRVLDAIEPLIATAHA